MDRHQSLTSRSAVASAPPERIIGTQRKNNTEQLRITRSRWRGVEMLGLRVWSHGEDSGPSRPTREGLNLRLELLPGLILLLERARRDAVVAGLLLEEGAEK
ncbi:PC4/YdbC family ssDNA-binding protein [Hypericibacter sp.]|uniref:PC4/YdbC family ssDNA-binding protein n=1 Tax=Hypericibacter sp. TaxID=2705401 RepID=UPI003D6CE0F6